MKPYALTYIDHRYDNFTFVPIRICIIYEYGFTTFDSVEGLLYSKLVTYSYAYVASEDDYSYLTISSRFESKESFSFPCDEVRGGIIDLALDY